MLHIKTSAHFYLCIKKFDIILYYIYCFFFYNCEKDKLCSYLYYFWQ